MEKFILLCLVCLTLGSCSSGPTSHDSADMRNVPVVPNQAGSHQAATTAAQMISPVTY